MIVLTRKVDQTIKIGDSVIMVVRIDRNTVKIGINAAPGVLVLRGELPDRPAKSATPNAAP